MYLVTNRNLVSGKSSLDRLGTKTNEDGPHELRLVKVSKTGSSYKTELLRDKLKKSNVRTLKKKYALDIDPDEPH